METKGLRNLIDSMIENGYPLDDLALPTNIFKDNESCVAWSYNMTSKRIRHISLRENLIREWVQDGIIEILHVPGKVNPADLFTKKIKYGAHFRRLFDSFMSTLSSFVLPLPRQSPSMSTHQVAKLDRSSLLAFLATIAEIVNTYS